MIAALMCIWSAMWAVVFLVTQHPMLGVAMAACAVFFYRQTQEPRNDP